MRVEVVQIELARGVGAWFTRPPRADLATPRPAVGVVGNLAHTRPHQPAELAATRAEAAERMGIAPDSVVLMRQVHGDRVAVVDADTPTGAEIRDVDGLVTAEHDAPLAVQAADCVPLLVAADDGPVGVAHAGRLGVRRGVVGNLLTAMAALGVAPSDLHAAIGPSIGGCCYEVPEAMRAEVSAVVPAAHATTTWGTPSLDLPAAVEATLRAAGVRDVRPSPACTRCGDGWFSHRRDPSTGRQWGVVVRRGPAAARHGDDAREVAA